MTKVKTKGVNKEEINSIFSRRREKSGQTPPALSALGARSLPILAPLAAGEQKKINAETMIKNAYFHTKLVRVGACGAPGRRAPAAPGGLHFLVYI